MKLSIQAASDCTNIGATDAKTETQKLLDAVRQLVRERIYHLQTEPEPALPYHFKLLIRLFYVPKIPFHALCFSTLLTEWNVERTITSSRLCL